MTKKKVSLEPRFCKICNVSIDELKFSSKSCTNPECKRLYANLRARENYSKNLVEKTCEKCGDLFLATQKQKQCENCRDSRKDNKFKQIEQKIVCKHCGSIIEVVTKNVTRTAEELKIGVCDDCKSNLAEYRSQSMKLNNPSYDKKLTEEEYLQKVKERNEYNSEENKTKRREVFLQKSRERMIANNPMFNPESVLKMRKTFKERIDSGEIVYKKGLNHHLYKGNRNFNKQVRIELRN